MAHRLGYRSRPRGLGRYIDALVLVWLAWIFDATNNLADVRQRLAEHHGGQILNLEQALRLAPERALNRWLAAHHALSQIVVFYYENVHAAVTFAVLAWLWWHRPDLLGSLRATLMLANLAGLAVFWSFPVAPPRMLVTRGYVDLVAAVHHVPVWMAGATSAQANQLSSLPSLHIAWAVWSALALWRLSARTWVRGLALGYPLLTTYAVMATANHYLADAVTGAVTLVGAAVVVSCWLGYRCRRRTVSTAEELLGESPPVVARIR